jgi:hypothetical protein
MCARNLQSLVMHYVCKKVTRRNHVHNTLHTMPLIICCCMTVDVSLTDGYRSAYGTPSEQPCRLVFKAKHHITDSSNALHNLSVANLLIHS